MNRREFLHRLKKPAIALAAVPAIAVAAADRGRAAIDPQLAALKSKYDAMHQRLDKLELSQKRTLRAVLVLTGISLGIDVSSLI